MTTSNNKYESIKRIKQELLIKLKAAMATGRYDLLPGLSREMDSIEEDIQKVILNNSQNNRTIKIE